MLKNGHLLVRIHKSQGVLGTIGYVEGFHNNVGQGAQRVALRPHDGGEGPTGEAFRLLEMIVLTLE